MRPRVLVTGATGVVGVEIVEQLQASGLYEVHGCSRRGAPAMGVESWDLGGEPVPAALQGPWDVVINSAASTRWNGTADEAHRANVATVDALGAVVGPSTHVVHISTAYALSARGTVDSFHIDDYNNTYEWSKAASERHAAESFEHLTIVRPPLVIGRRADGAVARHSGVYLLLRALVRSQVPAIVGVESAYIDVVAVDDFAAVVRAAVVADPSGGERPWVFAAGAQAPRLHAFVDTCIDEVNAYRRAHGASEHERPPIIPPDRWDRFFRPFAEDTLGRTQLRLLTLLEEFRPYLERGEPLQVTHQAPDPVPAVRTCVRAWMGRTKRATDEPRPWSASTRNDAQVVAP